MTARYLHSEDRAKRVSYLLINHLVLEGQPAAQLETWDFLDGITFSEDGRSRRTDLKQRGRDGRPLPAEDVDVCLAETAEA